MKERPILFSGAMVRAILSGRKTQTRRVVKGFEWIADTAEGVQPYWRYSDRHGSGPIVDGTIEWWMHEHAVFGKPGDRLWVKETHSIVAAPGLTTGAKDVVVQARYADGETRCASLTADELAKLRGRKSWSLGDQTPGIFMFCSLSRISLEIVSVRVERLQDISEGDAVAEGMAQVRDEWSGACGDFDETLTDLQLYKILWESINGAGSWEANPWVWVVEFKKL